MLDSFASSLAKAAWPATLASFVGSTLFLGSTTEVDPSLLVDSVNLHKIILRYERYNILMIISLVLRYIWNLKHKIY